MPRFKWAWMTRRAALLLILTALAELPPALGAPKAELWRRWTAHDPTATGTIDHRTWGRILKTYLVTDAQGLNRFDYGGVAIPDRIALDRYVARLAGLAIDGYDRREQFAFWVNLYNALTIQLILKHYPVKSIRDIDISPGLFADGPWGKRLIAVTGTALSLDDIEHRILRPIWQDPRIHYAVNCASVGCPNLQMMPFTGENAGRLLDKAARDYVNSPRGVQRLRGRLAVSSIYVWYREDFGGSDEGVIAHLLRYARPALAAKIRQRRKLADHFYDWSLNDASMAGR